MLLLLLLFIIIMINVLIIVIIHYYYVIISFLLNYVIKFTLDKLKTNFQLNGLITVRFGKIITHKTILIKLLF